MVVIINSTEEYKEALATTGKTVVLYFTATWCGPCKMIGPIVEKLEPTFSNLAVYKIDVDALSDVAEEVGIKSMPTFVFFKDGEKVGTVIGADPQKLKAAFEHHNSA